jgi:hypothetical protein
MSHATADLEFFKCDMCGVYMHKDLFCDHRRACKGRDSVELTKKQAEKVADVLDSSEHKALASTGQLEATSLRLSVAANEKRQISNTRTKLQMEYLKEKEKEQAAKQLMSVDDALAFLNS